MLVFWVIVGLALVTGAISLREDRSRGRYLRERLTQHGPRKFVPATVIVPVKDEDHDLRENLAALAGQDYPDFELIVTVREAGDIPPGVVPESARVVIAGAGDPATGEKINNLVAAVASARPVSEVFAFADSDGRVAPGWLAALAQGLEEEGTGAATGYRHYLPAAGGFWPLLRSVWNAVIAGGFGPGDNRFAWGGAMAIRRQTFHQARVLEHWRGSVSDDYMLSRAVHSTGLRIVYEPGAQAISTGGTTAGRFLGWIRRQMIITRVYAPRLWGLALTAHLIYCGAMTASLALAFQGNLTGVYTLSAQLMLGFWKGANRLGLMRQTLPAEADWLRRYGWAHIWLTPLATWVWLIGLAASAVSNEIVWRGRRYRLR